MSSVTSLIGYIISYTQTILVIMVFRDRNSNSFHDFKRFFDSITYLEMCLIWRVLRRKMCPGTQRKSRIRAHCFSNYLSRDFKF